MIEPKVVMTAYVLDYGSPGTGVGISGDLNNDEAWNALMLEAVEHFIQNMTKTDVGEFFKELQETAMRDLADIWED